MQNCLNNLKTFFGTTTGKVVAAAGVVVLGAIIAACTGAFNKSNTNHRF